LLDLVIGKLKCAHLSLFTFSPVRKIINSESLI
jgi:hypothetical protein